MKLNLEDIVNVLKDIRNYVFPLKKITSKFRKINSKNDLKNFIQERSAHVTQTTLYGYLKTRIGTRYALMFEDKEFSKSINIAKWNIYMAALSDCSIYVFSYLISQKNLKENDCEDIFLEIIENEKNNGLADELYEKVKIDFLTRVKTINWQNYYENNPFKNSSIALYNWSPITDELKVLDKEIVLNSIILKWNLVENEFKELTKDLNFN